MAFKDLEPHIQIFIETYVDSDKTLTELGEELNVLRTTISDWISTYKEEIDVILSKIRDSVMNELQKGAKSAIKNVRAIADTGSGEDSVKLRACEILLNKYLPTRTENATEITGKSVSISIEEAK